MSAINALPYFSPASQPFRQGQAGSETFAPTFQRHYFSLQNLPHPHVPSARFLAEVGKLGAIVGASLAGEMVAGLPGAMAAGVASSTGLSMGDQWITNRKIIWKQVTIDALTGMVPAGAGRMLHEGMHLLVEKVGYKIPQNIFTRIMEPTLTGAIDGGAMGYLSGAASSGFNDYRTEGHIHLKNMNHMGLKAAGYGLLGGGLLGSMLGGFAAYTRRMLPSVQKQARRGFFRSRPIIPQARTTAPKLFTKMTPEEMAYYYDGQPWQDPKLEKPLSLEEIRRILKTPHGAINIMNKVGPHVIIKEMGLQNAIESVGLKRFAKEVAKYYMKDPHQDYTAIAFRGNWVHRHDMRHLLVADLPTIDMGKAKGVNGIDGISSRIAGHFHPDDPQFKPLYNGMLDEYRVAIDTWVNEGTPSALVRLWSYQIKMLPKVKNPFAPVIAHRRALNSDGRFNGKILSTKPSLAQVRRAYNRSKAFLASRLRLKAA